VSPIAAILALPFRPGAALALIVRGPDRTTPSLKVAGGVYAVGLLAFAALPLLSPEARAAGNPWLGTGAAAVLLAATNFFYVLGVDLTMDPRIQKKRAGALLHRTLISSGAFGLLTAVLVAGAVAGGAGRPIVGALLAATIWWQWMVEAVGLRDLYEIPYPAAFGLEALMRSLSTIVGGWVGWALLTPLAMLIERLT
jgi:hypothetical protein